MTVSSKFEFNLTLRTPDGVIKTLDQWQEFARRDDCLDRMVPSDLRCILSSIKAILDSHEAMRVALGKMLLLLTPARLALLKRLNAEGPLSDHTVHRSAALHLVTLGLAERFGDVGGSTLRPAANTLTYSITDVGRAALSTLNGEVKP